MTRVAQFVMWEESRFGGKMVRVTRMLVLLVLLAVRTDCQLPGGCGPELNATTISQNHRLPEQAVYLKVAETPPNVGTATLNWKTDGDSYNDTLNLSINSTNGWQELKMSSYNVPGLEDNVTVTIVHIKDQILKVFRGDLRNRTSGDAGEQSEDEITGELLVQNSINLVWVIGCNPNTATSVEMTTTTPGISPFTSSNPPNTPRSTPTTLPNDSSNVTMWMCLAIVTLILLLVTMFCVICLFVKRSTTSLVTGVHNGGGTVGTMESGSLSNSKASLMNSNSESCRSRLPSNATPKRETVTLGLNALKTQSIGSDVPPSPTTLHPLPLSPSPHPHMPSYIPPNPLEVALAMNQDNDDESDHDYDYLDLNMLKIQIEKNKAEEQKKRREQEEGLTHHDSENSMYETFSPPAEDETKNEDKERNEDQEKKKEEKGGLAGHGSVEDDNTDDNGTMDNKQEEKGGLAGHGSVEDDNTDDNGTKDNKQED